MDQATDPLSAKTLDFSFDDAGEVTALTYGTEPSSPARTYNYDDLGRLTSDLLKDGSGVTQTSFAYSYDPDGNLVSQEVSLPGNLLSGDERSSMKAALSHFEIQDGFLKCMESSWRKRRAIFRLFAAGEFGLAAFLAAVRIEEVTKAYMLLEAGDGRITGGDWETFWKIFASHQDKWAIYYNAVASANLPREECPYSQPLRTTSQFKNLCLYFDYAENRNNWRTPWEHWAQSQVKPTVEQGDAWETRVRRLLLASPWSELAKKLRDHPDMSTSL